MSPTTPSDAQHYDLVIVGGGLVGASLALSLNKLKLRIALVEATPWRGSETTEPRYDDRAIALSFGSRRIFEGIGLWPHIHDKATAIRKIHVSDQGRFGITRLDSRQENVEALGYVITGRELGKQLLTQLDQQANEGSLEIIAPARVTQLQFDNNNFASLKISHQGNEQTLATPLVVAADGGQSTLRELVDIEVHEQDYQQCAIVANLSPSNAHAGVAYERFTPDGPMALLPLVDARPDTSSEDDNPHRCGLVWTRNPAEAERLMKLDDAAFLAEAQNCFGQRLGRFTRIGQRHSYPLQLIRAEQQVQPRMVLIGNAAHTLHPIAGQGFNLGLRDVATLAQVIADANRAQTDLGALSTLQPYAQWRARDQRQVIGFTHFLVESFSSHFAPLALARNLGLLAMDITPPLKHGLARQAMGLAGKLPRLARGLPL